MRKVGTYSFTYPSHDPSAFERGWTDTSACSHDSQIGEEGSDGGSISHNESFQPPSTSSGQNVVDANAGTGVFGLPTVGSHQVTPVDTTPNFSLSPTASPGGKPGLPLFQCTHCPKRYTQKQVLKRHEEEKHKPGSSLNCWYTDCNYKWTTSRSSEYRRHLGGKHGLEDDNINEILGPPRRHRRRDRVIETDLPPHFSPPPIEHDRQSRAEPQQHPLMLPLELLPVGKDGHHASPPPIPSVAYNPGLGHAEPAITTTKHQDSSGLERLAATHAPSELFSKEDLALLAGYSKISLRNNGRIRFPPPWRIHYCRHPTQPYS